MKRISTLSSLVVATACLTGGCPQAEEEAPPELPPVNSMAMELSALTSAPAVAKSGGSAALGDYENFANAYTRVAIVDLAALAVVALPAAAIALAIDQPGEQLSDGSFHWSVTVLGSTADVFVDHSLANGWDGQLFISNASQQNFLWVEGAFTSLLNEGSWTLHDPNLPAGNDVSLEILWDYRAANDFSLTYRNANQQSEGFGDTMDFALVGRNASLVYDDASEPTQVATILWDAVTAEGGIQVPGFNEGQESCWDASFVNTACK
jgi:hypothetical protein